MVASNFTTLSGIVLAVALAGNVIAVALGNTIERRFLGAMIGNEKGGKLRDFSAKEMTRSQLKKAQDLACECVRKKYKGC